MHHCRSCTQSRQTTQWLQTFRMSSSDYYSKCLKRNVIRGDSEVLTNEHVAQLVRRLASLSLRQNASAEGLIDILKVDTSNRVEVMQLFQEYLMPTSNVPRDIEDKLMLYCEEKCSSAMNAGGLSGQERDWYLRDALVTILDDHGYSEFVYKELQRRVFDELELMLANQESAVSERKLQFQLVREELSELVKVLDDAIFAENKEADGDDVATSSSSSIRTSRNMSHVTLESFANIADVNHRLVQLFGFQRVSAYHCEVFGTPLDPLPRPNLLSDVYVSLISSDDEVAPAVDLDDVCIVNEKPASSVPRRIITYPELGQERILREGEQVLAITAMDGWRTAEVLQCVNLMLPPSRGLNDPVPVRRYKLRFIDDESRQEFGMASYHLALCENEWNEKKLVYPVATRVVADRHRRAHQSNGWASGTVFESPTDINNNRYLIYFDTGSAFYVHPRYVLRSCYQPIKNFFELREKIQSFEFLTDYLQRFPERVLVRLKEGQLVKVQRDGRWQNAKVLQLDQSMAYMLFQDDAKEWIFRGSMRFSNVFEEQSRRNATLSSPMPRRPRAHTGSLRTPGPVVEYVQENSVYLQAVPALPAIIQANLADRRPIVRRPSNSSLIDSSPSHLSRPSSSQGSRSPSKASNLVIVNGDLSGGEQIDVENAPPRGSSPAVEPMRYTFVNMLADVLQKRQPSTFRVHAVCNGSCLRFAATPNDPPLTSDDPQQWRGRHNPLSMPILAGWSRHRFVRQDAQHGSHPHIMYAAPCGRTLRKISEVQQFLTATRSHLSVDFFCFDPEIDICIEYRASGVLMEIADFSEGREDVPLHCINTLNREKPPPLDYRRARFTKGSLQLNEDPGFLVCCDCTDDCSKSVNCACRKLTVEGTAQVHPHHRANPTASYKYRRLDGQLMGGLFECNSRCSCKKRHCLNRVVQNGMWVKLQMFKTKHKGWGVRALHDIPKGAFICVYAGEIYDSATADKAGVEVGDEYQADLDYIEAVERRKEGYEQNAVFPEDEPENEHPLGENGWQGRNGASDSDSDEDFVRSGVRRKKTKLKRKGKNGKKRKINGGNGKPTNGAKSPGSTEAGPSLAGTSTVRSRETATETNGDPAIVSVLRRSTRAYLGEEDPYVMDAKLAGNLGRYFNHACEPNMYVQNVLVNSHDPRIPEIAFFAYKNIKAGEEMTWDYQYEPNSVENRTLMCQCDSENCRRRLL